ncbi:unnamed protein product [Angiostrongylus costaricensis]|uniref:Secreted protein n=1 Tax=Angiostrongylus costaricensis TaxID=334426 RepID=A0A0R3PM97_ANGCS|nr:unnamed protein product [Angiostrongylus costaricensis]
MKDTIPTQNSEEYAAAFLLVIMMAVRGVKWGHWGVGGAISSGCHVPMIHLNVTMQQGTRTSLHKARNSTSDEGGGS